MKGRRQQNRSRPLGLVEAAKRLDVSPRSLRNRSWRRKHHIPWIKKGGLVFYDAEALDRWRFDRRGTRFGKGRRPRT